MSAVAEPGSAALDATPFRGILYKVCATGLFASMSAIIKWVGDDYPIGQLVFVRSFFALIPVFLLIRWAGGLKALRTRRPGAHLLRSLSGITAMSLSFSALTMLPIADATALGFVAPLIATALGSLLLGEAVRVYRWTAVAIGFCGVLLMVQPQGAQGGGFLVAGIVPLGVMLALCGAFFTALAQIAIRRMSGTEPSIAIVFYFTLTCTIFGALTLPFDHVIPTGWDILLLVMIGLLGGFAQVVMTSSYRHAPVATLAPFDYVTMLWALLIGYFVFAELPRPLVLAGAAVVMSSGIFILWREHRLGIERARVRRAGGAPTPPAV
ncbi:DMT family transporter [Inquilinus sp. CAU 1745]|uniref:DMT family transporter n=1 Tax=Inquilinus sp. CAU 1745 TaxID=3140369 RepID=UPI00325B4058